MKRNNSKWIAAVAVAGLVAGLVPAAGAQDVFGQQPHPQPQYPQPQPQYPQPQPQYPQPQPQYPQPQPQPQPYPQPGPAGGGGGGGGANLDQLAQQEKQDFGVPATPRLHDGAMHGPTPTSIPGGQLITTKGLAGIIQGRQVPAFIFDVLGGPETLPNAMQMPFLAQPGSFNDQLQQQFSQMLNQGTQGKKDTVLVFYCLSTHCWMSYNAALRAINAGYKNVLWYRGGLEAWKAAGFPTQPAQQQQQPGGYPPQQPGGYPPQQPGGYPPQQPGGYPPQQPGGYPPQQPGGYPQQPQQPGGYQQPGG